jgi:hypothetical protein
LPDASSLAAAEAETVALLAGHLAAEAFSRVVNEGAAQSCVSELYSKQMVSKGAEPLWAEAKDTWLVGCQSCSRDPIDILDISRPSEGGLTQSSKILM